MSAEGEERLNVRAEGGSREGGDARGCCKPSCLVPSAAPSLLVNAKCIFSLLAAFCPSAKPLAAATSQPAL